MTTTLTYTDHALRTSRTSGTRRALALLSALLLCAPFASAPAQSGTGGAAPADTATRNPTPLAAITVTATRTSTETFSVPQAVSVIDSASARERLAGSPIELFRQLPGLDVTGVGTNQARPQIRGQRGQRILLLEDALRLNNSRRQQDFGELPALSGLVGFDRVEVVHGPSSVLYGTDAIAGVVNIISADLPASSTDGEVRGYVGYRHGGAGDQRQPSVGTQGRFGRFAFRANAAYRESTPYFAPSGTFGNVTLSEDVQVHGTGVRDRSFDLTAGWDMRPNQRLFARAKQYRAQNAGFGYVDPELLGAGQPLIDIGYPDQTYSRYVLGYRGTSLGTLFADRVEIATYLQRNDRDLTMHVLVPLGPTASLDSRSLNVTNLHTVGLRAEAARLLAGRHMLTYGVDYFRDRSTNTDSSTMTVTGFGPPQTSVNRTALVPNAAFRSAGAFAQVDFRYFERLSTIVGIRVQDIAAETRETPDITRPLVQSNHRTAVGTANLLYRVTGDLHLISAVGRGFRSPNLVERFFEGPAAEGSGYQRANADLEPETSINVDLGVRYRRGPFYTEAFAFRNQIRDGIRIEATGDSVNHQPAFRNVNVDKLRHSGVELLTGLRLLNGVELAASYTRMDTENISDPNSPVGDSYGTKLTGDVAYRHPSARFMIGYSVRHNGEQKDAIIGTSPIGNALPAFTVHSLRGNVLLFDRGGIRNVLGVSVENLTDELYAEFSNAAFFRPEPRRSVNLSWTTEF
jgi:outer membrane receptor protein involved in Fe transport